MIASQGPLQTSPAAGWLPPELKPRTQRPWKIWVCQPPPAGLGPSTSGLSEQIWTVVKCRRKSCSSILDSGPQSDPAQPPITRTPNSSTIVKFLSVHQIICFQNDPQIPEPSRCPRFLYILRNAPQIAKILKLPSNIVNYQQMSFSPSILPNLKKCPVSPSPSIALNIIHPPSTSQRLLCSQSP